MNDAEIRADVLDTAKGYVLKDRNSTYGSPEDNFKRIARRWTAHLQNVGVISDAVQLNAADVAIMMTDMKLARIEHNPGHKDSWVDAAGYIACGAGIALAAPPNLGTYELDITLSKPIACPTPSPSSGSPS